MGLKKKLGTAARAARLTAAVALNTGRIPRGHKCMVLIEPTSVCNLACPLCPTGTGTLERDNKYIPVETFDRILELTAPLAEGYVLNLFGEPSFHPRFAELLEKTRRLPTWLSTNLSYGEAAAREMARWDHLRVICSIDTVDPEEYPKYRIHGDWETVMRNLRILSEGVCEVHPQFLVPPDHADDTPYVEFARSFGIPAGNVIIKKKMENFRLDPTDAPSPGNCHSAYLGIYFNCDGYLLPCCNNARKDLHMIHVNDITSHRDILDHENLRRMRRRLAKDKNAFPSCGNCDGINFWKQQMPIYLAALKSLLPGHRKRDTPDRMAF